MESLKDTTKKVLYVVAVGFDVCTSFCAELGKGLDEWFVDEGFEEPDDHVFENIGAATALLTMGGVAALGVRQLVAWRRR
jgi:hypothetical protein